MVARLPIAMKPIGQSHNQWYGKYEDIDLPNFCECRNCYSLNRFDIVDIDFNKKLPHIKCPTCGNDIQLHAYFGKIKLFDNIITLTLSELLRLILDNADSAKVIVADNISKSHIDHLIIKGGKVHIIDSAYNVVQTHDIDNFESFINYDRQEWEKYTFAVSILLPYTGKYESGRVAQIIPHISPIAIEESDSDITEVATEVAKDIVTKNTEVLINSMITAIETLSAPFNNIGDDKCSDSKEDD